MDGIEQGWYDLAAAVVEQACDDYRIAWIVDDDKQIRVLEKFFRSKYFNVISNIDPNWLIRNLREKYTPKREERRRKQYEKQQRQGDVYFPY